MKAWEVKERTLDLTELRMTLDALRHSEARQRILLEQIPAVAWTTDTDLLVASPLGAGLAALDLGREEVVGMSIAEFFGTTDLRARPITAHRLALQGTPSTFEAEWKGRSMQARVEPLVERDGTITGTIGVAVDITERKRAERAQSNLAAIVQSSEDAIISTDLDGIIESWNPGAEHAYGYSADDVMGEPISLLVPIDRPNELPEIRERIQSGEHIHHFETVRMTKDGRRLDVSLTASPILDAEGGVVGTSYIARDITDRKQALRESVFLARGGERTSLRGPAVLGAERADVAGRTWLEEHLREAVDQEQWVLHYQPIVDLLDGHLVGVEALLRWADPGRGLLPPGEFITLAEELDLVDPIGDWVVREVCHQAKAWEKKGLDLISSINLSWRQLGRPDLVERMIHSIGSAGVDPSKLSVEVAESVVMIDPERVREVLWEIHRQDIRLSIDDFGTGLTSWPTLRELPVDVLKIDRSLVSELPDDAESAGIVAAVTQLADNLGLQVLGEGIETEEQWHFLQDNGCSFGQGFHFGRPVPAEDISALALPTSGKIAS
jgi:PAS domain S-box-containing protein